MLEICSIFILIFTWLTISNWVWAFSDMQFYPSAFFPIQVWFEVNNELSCCPVKINFIIKDWSDLLEVRIVYFDSADTCRKVKHFTSQLNCIFACLFNFQNSQLPLSYQNYDSNCLLISCNTDTNMSVVGIHEYLSFFVHFQKKVTCFNEVFFGITSCNLHIFFVVWDYFTGTEINIVTNLITKSFKIGLIRGWIFETLCVLLSNTGKRNIFVDERKGFDLSFFVEIEHELCFDFGQSIKVFLERHIKIIIFILITIVSHMLTTLSLIIFVILSVTLLLIMITELLFLISNIEFQIVSVRIRHFKCDLLIVMLSKVLFF